MNPEGMLDSIWPVRIDPFYLSKYNQPPPTKLKAYSNTIHREATKKKKLSTFFMYSARPSLSLGFAKIADGSRLACFPPLSYGLSQITDHPSILHPNILTSLTWRYWGIHTPVSTWETALWPSYSTGILKLNSRIGLGAFKHFHHLSSGEGGGGGGGGRGAEQEKAGLHSPTLNFLVLKA